MTKIKKVKKDKIKDFRLEVLNKQKQFYMREISNVKEIDESYFMKQKLDKNELIGKVWESINKMIGIIASPNTGCSHMGIEETNKIVKNLIDLKLVLERENEGVYSEKNS